ncbi:MAG TPA: prepilin peptidase [Candidatus Borkfalkia faecipullorum]|uniref:Prepilin leader peptidase/N-methyltransferase n=1 Tax=Candidatus Borkfalkia faecipullorum TaxID=2838510 RepID=A0A9D2AF61_9FIRM|nr:prepilin peptidase [Candidatus Borkfalkia faecipullorum]
MEQFYYITTCVLFAVLGLCIGSFLNVLIYRLPRGMNLAKPASHCTVCGHKIAWYDNIPLLSYLILRGKCRSCGARISPRYFLVELSNAALWISCCLAVYRDVTSIPVAAVYALALSVLLTMAVTDMENLFLPDSLQIALFVIALAGVFTDLSQWQDKLWGLLLGGGFFLFIYCLSFVLFQKEGLGFGDVKLMASAGLLLGWKGVVVATVLAVAVALADIVIRKLFLRRGETLPCAETGEEFAFAPYLAFGTAAALFCGTALFDGYLALFL